MTKSIAWLSEPLSRHLIPEPAHKLDFLVEQVMAAFAGDADLRMLLLLEGRRVPKEGHMIMLSRGFREFVQLVDAVLGEMRDQLLQYHQAFPASYTQDEMRRVFEMIVAAFRPAAIIIP